MTATSTRAGSGACGTTGRGAASHQNGCSLKSAAKISLSLATGIASARLVVGLVGRRRCRGGGAGIELGRDRGGLRHGHELALIGERLGYAATHAVQREG